jgi:hypothetical protein
MADQWMIRGAEYGNCNCIYACPCQFYAPTTNGFCQAVAGGIIEEGRFNETRLDGLNWVIVLSWPGEIADGNGSMQVIIDERATPEQREALRKILQGESTTPGATHFNVFASTMSKIHEALSAPIEISIDIDARRGRISVPGLVESTASPLRNPFTGGEHGVSIVLDEGFEYQTARIGSGSSKVTAGIEMELNDSYGQFNVLHMNQDGLIRN